MDRTHEFRKRSEQRSDLLAALGTEVDESSEVLHMRPPPMSTGEEALPLDLSSHLESGLSPASDAALAGCEVRVWSPDSKTMISFAGSEPSRGAEELRALRSKLVRLRETRALKSLLISSARPGEGRSFVAANLASVLALQPHCRVLLIDGDLRGPRLHQTLGTSLTPGLAEYLMEEAAEFSFVQKGDGGSIYFVPAGRAVPGPTELLGTGRLKAFIDRCKPLFDWIIVDSPSSLPVSDASLISNACDGVLMVVRSGFTPFDLVRKAMGRFRAESLVGVVLNEIEEGSIPPRR